MAREPLVSVVIPTYNNAGLVGEAVESVLAQTYRRKEIIVVDDGSTDGTAARLEKFGSMMTLIRQEHLGPPAARNAGIRKCSGELVGFLDSDDLWMPEKLERCVPMFEKSPGAGVVYTALRIHEIDTGQRYRLPQYSLSGSIARDLFLECRGVNTSTLLVRRSCFDVVGLFDEELFRAQDWDLMVRLAEAFEYVHVPEVLTERRLHRGSLSVTHRHLYKKYNLRVLEKALARKPSLYADLKQDAFSRAHFRFGMDHYADCRMRAARGEFAVSMRYRWNWKAFDYFMRACLPGFVVRPLRRRRLARTEPAEREDPGEGGDA